MIDTFEILGALQEARIVMDLARQHREPPWRVLERCHRVFQFDLRRMIAFGPDYNQAVKDAADSVEEALRYDGAIARVNRVIANLEKTMMSQ